MIELLEGRQLWSATPVGIGHLAAVAEPPVCGEVATTVEAMATESAAIGKVLLTFDTTAVNCAGFVMAKLQTAQTAVETTDSRFSDHVIEKNNAGNGTQMTLQMGAAGDFCLGGISSGGFSFDCRIDPRNMAVSSASGAAGADERPQLSQEDQQLVRNTRATDDDDADDDADGEETEADGSSASGMNIIRAAAL